MKTLYIANKNYSSWSLRPWVLMQVLGISFEEVLSSFNTGQYWQDFRKFSPNGMVPCLIDGELTVWDSLAIMEYLAESYPQVWTRNKKARSWSRCASAEMHSGFTAIRNQCTMNCGLRIRLSNITPSLEKDINRLDELFNQGLNQFNGPFLAGESFTAVDAMFAPIAFRTQTYDLPFSQSGKDYLSRILELPVMQDWYNAALKESWREPEHELEAQNSGEIWQDLRAI